MSRCRKRLDQVSFVVGRGVMFCSLLMVLLTFIIVLFRHVFDLGWIALQESVMYLHAILFMCGAAYTLRQDQHVRVDIFYQGFSNRGKAKVNIFGSLCLLMPVCVFIFFSSSEYVWRSWLLLEKSNEAGGLPLVFALKTLIPVFALLLFLQGFVEVLRNAAVLKGGKQ